MIYVYTMVGRCQYIMLMIDVHCIAQDDEEWNEIEEEVEKDYSGLRVQNLQISYVIMCSVHIHTVSAFIKLLQTASTFSDH